MRLRVDIKYKIYFFSDSATTKRIKSIYLIKFSLNFHSCPLLYISSQLHFCIKNKVKNHKHKLLIISYTENNDEKEISKNSYFIQV